MASDKSWMEIEDRKNINYINGVEHFLEFAFENLTIGQTIQCPCLKCRNVIYKQRSEVTYHLIKYGIVKSYTLWYFHGEKWVESVDSDDDNDFGDHEAPCDDMIGLVNSIFNVSSVPATMSVESSDINSNATIEEPNDEAAKFYRLLNEAKENLYLGCEHSKLAVIVKLLHLKSRSRWTNRSFDGLLSILRGLIPNGKQTLPESYSSAKKYIAELGLGYVKYDVCLNNCTLYWGSYAEATSCPICAVPRWKFGNRNDDGLENKKRVAHKVLRYFPLKPRLQRMFMASKVAMDMKWHKEKRVDDPSMWHPGDTPAWKSFDEKHISFASDPRNVRLGLATDGFQPFGNMSSQHSIWPVVLIPYNLPPWLCMKEPYFILSMLIPGEHSPGMSIDVFLQPLVEELKELWEVGVETFDAHLKQNFRLHAAVLWTINDFPAYGDLSGWSTKGYKACPSCHKHTKSEFLRGSRKMCYLGSRQFLPLNHKWRRNAKRFDGTIEMRGRPIPLSGEEVLIELSKFSQRPFGRGIKRKYDASNSVDNWRKKSIFFELPYWKTLLIRHNLDVMHIEKNVCDSVLGTVMNIKGKTKDTINSRYDLVRMEIRPELHPFPNGNNMFVPVARYVLSDKEKEALCHMLANLKTPDGYLSKISRCVNIKERKIFGMKSHDCHIFLQHLLPIAIRGFLPKDICEPLVELSAFFRDLCCKSLNTNDLNSLENQVILTLCKLEMIFPPSFFDIMVHLVLHLVEEARIAGPVHYRWMYPLERYLRTCKSYVRNKAQPEGSIAEAYIVDECLTFCSRYLKGVDTKFNQPSRNDESNDGCASIGSLGVFTKAGRPLGKVDFRWLDLELKQKAHVYVLNNCEEVWPFIEEYKNSLPRMSHSELMHRYNSEFPNWFYEHVVKLHAQGSVSRDLLCLAEGPTHLKMCSGYIVNGFRFHTLERQKHRRSQNSGVMCRGDDNSSEKEYYGILEEVWELQYVGINRVHLFKCDWFDVQNKGLGYKIDNYSIISINANRRLKTNEPFILACQAKQVFYVEDPKNSNWLVVMKTQPREMYKLPISINKDVLEVDEIDDNEVFQLEDHDTYGRVTTPMDFDDEVAALNRFDVAAEVVSLDVALQIEKQIQVEASSNQELDNDDGDEEYNNLSDDNEDDYDPNISDDD